MSQKKKIALLLSGQFRTTDTDFVKKSWEKFYKEYDVTTFVCCWDNRGRSLGGFQNNINARDGINEGEKIVVDDISSIFKTNNIKLFNYEDWKNDGEIPEWMSQFQNSRYWGSTFSAGYLRAEVGKLFQEYLSTNGEIFDGVIMTRPDLYFIKQPPQHLFHDLHNIYHQNSHHTFYPDRIYDIFLLSSQENILKVCQWYESNISHDSIMNNIQHWLPREDTCRVMWVYFSMLGISHKSFELLYAEVYRNELDVNLGMKVTYGSGKESIWCLQ